MARRRVAGVTMAVVGLALATLQVGHALAQSSVPLAWAFEAGPFVLLALALAYAGYWLATAPAYEDDADRVLAWGAGGAITSLAVAALIRSGGNVATGSLGRGPSLAADLATVGVLAGVIVGLYDARSRESRRELEAERDRVRTFADRAAAVDNYARALDQCATVDDVAALLVQAVDALLGLDRAAVLEREGDGFRVVESSMPDADTGALATLAERSLEADPATVETYREDLPPSVAARTDTVLVLLVTDAVGPPVVLLAEGEGRPVADETVQLFELLAAHAGTALDALYASGQPMGV
jgi:hypothetical protein